LPEAQETAMPYLPFAPASDRAAASGYAGIDTGLLSSLPLGAAGGDAGLQTLQRFRDLMATHGHVVQVARMCFDRLYAYERIALAHAHGDDALREVALQLFQACHYADPAHRTLS
jgi:hypothetical protein